MTRPAPTMNERIATVACSARPSRSSSTIAARRSAGSDRSESAIRSSSLPSTIRAKRKSSSSISPRCPSAPAISSSRLRVDLDAVGHRLVAPDLVDEAVDELHLRGRGRGCARRCARRARSTSRRPRSAARPAPARAGARCRPAARAAISPRLVVGPRDELPTHLIGSLARFVDDAAGLGARVGELRLVLLSTFSDSVLRALGPLEIVADALLTHVHHVPHRGETELPHRERAGPRTQRRPR